MPAGRPWAASIRWRWLPWSDQRSATPSALGNSGQALDEILCQRIQRGGFGDQRRDLVQAFQPVRLFFELDGFFSHFGFQVFVHGLQMLGHAVETVGQGAEFVAGDAFNTGVKISLLDFFDGLFELAHRLQHKQVAGVEQYRGAHDDQSPAC